MVSASDHPFPLTSVQRGRGRQAARLHRLRDPGTRARVQAKEGARMVEVVRYETEGDVAVITVDNPPVNALGQAVRAGIRDGIERAAADDAVSAIALICAGRTFIAGADITEFGKPPLSPALREVNIVQEAVRKPLVAGIHGTALGGGLETALACHYRVAVESARVG